MGAFGPIHDPPLGIVPPVPNVTPGTTVVGGTIINPNGHTISGADGISGSGAAVTVANAGSIQGNSTSGVGIYLSAGGTVTNLNGGAISGMNGIFGADVAVNLVNYGSVAGNPAAGSGIGLLAGGSVTNYSSGTIGGSTGIYGAGAAVFVANAGSILQNASSGTGIDLQAGGTVINQSGGAIGGAIAIWGTVDTVTVVNYGSVEGNPSAGVAIALIAGGYVNNKSGGTLSGADGIYGFGAAVTVVNAGSIGENLTTSTGIDLQAGGSVINQTGGTVGGMNGIFGANAAVNLVNYGYIQGNSDTGAGVGFVAGGSVTNQSGGTITGYFGIYGSGAAVTVVNAGSIGEATTSSTGINLQAGGSVTNQSGGVISGNFAIYGAHTAVTVVNAGSIGGNPSSGVGINLQAGGSVTNQSGGVISGQYAIYGAGGPLTVLSAGSISGSRYAVMLSAGFADRLVIDPGAGFSGTVSGGNSLGAAAISTLELASAASAGMLPGLGTQFIDFAQITIDPGATWALQFSNPGSLPGLISGFQASDQIVVDTTQAASFSQSGSIISVIASGTTLGVLTFDSAANATLAANTSGALANVVAPCFVAGTRISTERGEVAVEDLREGDQVQVVLGGPVEPVVWIGHRTIDCTRHPQPRKVWPVRIAAGAFGPNRPCRTLYLSPDHAVYVGDVLIPVKHLINGSTIVQVPRDVVTYYHVELAEHSVLLAEGLAVESYLDIGDRSHFINGGGAIALYPDFASRVWDAEGCAPLVGTGPVLDAARCWVNALARVAIPAAAVFAEKWTGCGAA